MKTLFIVFFFIGLSLQCSDLGGEAFCVFILKEKNNICDNLDASDLAKCLKTCGACPSTSGSSGTGNKAPSWAYAPPSPRPPYGPKRKKPTESEDDGVQLPLYAVILIIIAVIAIFIGATLCIIKLKKKWKARKMKKNRMMLKNAPGTTNTMHPNYLWAGSYNSAYSPEMDSWSRNMYLPGEADTWHQGNKTLNNNATLSPGNRPNNKNINIIQNGTRDKRKAPEPPEESPYQNLQSATAGIDSNKKSKAPAPPPAATNAQTEDKPVVEIPIEYTDSVFSEPAREKDAKQQNAASAEYDQVESWQEENLPALPPRVPTTQKDRTKSPKKKRREKRKKKSKRRRDSDSSDTDDSSSDSSSERLDRTFSALTAETQEASPGLANILNEWKEHLLEQKRELEDYYKNLADYVQQLGLQPVSKGNRLSSDKAAVNRLKSNTYEKSRKGARHPDTLQYPDRQYASIAENFASLKFPEPPESVRGDFTWEPNDTTSQKQVVVSLKKKIARLQNLLESTQEAAESEKKSSGLYMPSKKHSQKYQDNGDMVVDSRITIKTLLQRLEDRERVKVQMRIAQALDSSRKRGAMDIASRDGPITCLTKQIHHVMTDILDPRTSTKIELGAHAACTLANKLLKNVHTNLLPVLRAERPRQEVIRTTDRISMLTKQLLDMTQQMISRQSSFQIKDYNVFVNAYVDTTQKVMDTTYQLVGIIVDLQRAERQSLVHQRSQTIAPASMPHLSLPPRSMHPSLMQQRRQHVQDKQQLLSRLHSESNATSLSVADVRQLHDDLARLKQLLNRDTKLPSFSATDTNAYIPENKDAVADFLSEFGYTVDGSQCDTMSTVSCSTCMPLDDMDPLYKPEDIPIQPRLPDKIAPETKEPPRPQNKVQYTEVIFPSEMQRPATRPPKGGVITLPRDTKDNPMYPLAPGSNKTSPVDSPKASQHKASTLDPSSFASFMTESEHPFVAQPRHQAMLARYFGGETLQPKAEPHQPVAPAPTLPESEEKPEEKNKSLTPAPAFPLHPNMYPESVEVPMVTMLPCGLVANDTPPITNPPKEKRKLPRIPEITVLRNGTEESKPNTIEDNEKSKSTDDTSGEDKTSSDQNFTKDDETEKSYHSTDTLPMREPKKIVQDPSEAKDSDSDCGTSVCSDLDKTTLKMPCSVDDDCDIFYDDVDQLSNLADDDAPDSFENPLGIPESPTCFNDDADSFSQNDGAGTVHENLADAVVSDDDSWVLGRDRNDEANTTTFFNADLDGGISPEISENAEGVSKYPELHEEDTVQQEMKNSFLNDGSDACNDSGQIPKYSDENDDVSNGVDVLHHDENHQNDDVNNMGDDDNNIPTDYDDAIVNRNGSDIFPEKISFDRSEKTESSGGASDVDTEIEMDKNSMESKNMDEDAGERNDPLNECEIQSDAVDAKDRKSEVSDAESRSHGEQSDDLENSDDDKSDDDRSRDLLKGFPNNDAAEGRAEEEEKNAKSKGKRHGLRVPKLFSKLKK